MKRLYLLALCLPLYVATSCSKDNVEFDPVADVDDSTLSHDAIVLGGQLENPYTVENVRSAISSLYPTRASMAVEATDLYVRFLPVDEQQLALLYDAGVTLVDHPIDYEIVKDGDFYHDPSVGTDEITWQYAVVPAGFEFPDVKYEIIDQCYIADAAKTRADDGIDWDAVEREAFRLTGNEAMLNEEAVTRGGTIQPSGRITIIDADANGGKPFGVAGVRVDCNVFVKFSTTYTDRDGYYTIPKKFSADPRYRLVFKNEKGFCIGVNEILYPASVSTLGKNTPSGVNITVDASSERKLFRRCTANNAAYEYLQRCDAADLGLTLPPSDLRIWMFDNMDSSSAIMLRHGTVLDKEDSNIYFKIASYIVSFFGPDITIGSMNSDSYAKIYALVVHEMAHTSHFQQVGKDYWDKYIISVISSTLSGKDAYGDGNQQYAGYCCVGEMWAYYLQSKMYKERYGGANPEFGSGRWFHPQIFTSLEERGLTASQLLSALNADVIDADTLRQRLVSRFPDKKTLINQSFNRYE